MSTQSFRVKAVYDYSSPHDDDLSFPNGQIITVTDEEDESWYSGEYEDAEGAKHSGLFPRNFVERYEPTTPPRPTRAARPKKEAEPMPIARDAVEVVPQPPHEIQQVQEKEHDTGLLREPATAETEQHSKDPQAPEVANDDLSQQEPTKVAPPAATVAKPAAKPPPPAAAKPVPQPTAAPPVVGSFRDRIAAFNKSTVAPPPPTKPGALGAGAGSSFVKKPFVPPPPSRNAYVPISREQPAAKIYRREEDPEMLARSGQEVEATGDPVAAIAADGAAEEQPKPTSLKERIALLQKQQLEQAAKHADAAQKKEKPKRPPKKRMESQLSSSLGVEDDGQEVAAGTENGRPAVDTTDDEPQSQQRPSTSRTKSKEGSMAMTPTALRRELHNDPNDADQSAAGETEDGGYLSAEKEDPEDRPRAPAGHPAAEADAIKGGHNHLAADGEEEQDEERDEEQDEEQDEEEEEMDPEVKRRMELRERMAKMSGGMGMAGMFGPPGGLPQMMPKKQKSVGSSSTKDVSHGPGSVEKANSQPQPHPVPLPGMSATGMQRVRSPEHSTQVFEAQDPSDFQPEPEEMPPRREMSNEAPPLPNTRQSEGRGAPPPVPHDRTPALPTIGESRAAPPIPSAASPPLPIPEALISPTSGSESDDELSPNAKDRPLDRSIASTLERGAPAIPPREPPANAPRRPTSSDDHEPPMSSIPSPDRNAFAATKRSSRVPPMPPVPGPPPPTGHPHSRAPPPPPPEQPPPDRQSSDDARPRRPPPPPQSAESDEEITEYDGDYDTDMASGATHKEALKTTPHGFGDDTLTSEEALYHHQGLPSLGLASQLAASPPMPSSTAPRAIPPPPPQQPPRHARQSSDMPRAAPPPPPPPSGHQIPRVPTSDYDPYNYNASQHSAQSSSTRHHGERTEQSTAELESDDDLYDASPMQSPTVPIRQKSSHGPPPSAAPLPPRQPLDVPPGPSTRRSMDQPRMSLEQGFMAEDVDLGHSSQWWLQRKLPPPIFQSRSDITYEVDESASAPGKGQHSIKKVHVLYMDYSQTIITAHPDHRDPSRADLQQRHEAPPSRLRQDQLEAAHTRFGTRLSDAAATRVNAIIGDGSPAALLHDLLAALPAALPPVGTRAFGALVYANLANATVQQHDEIRPGDVVSFRNARLQGHKGPMKTKYALDVGRPDHVAVVLDWDGTKKKVRAWEQGRESKKVKLESFKLGDLRSGEVKVWRIMGREWVGWSAGAGAGGAGGAGGGSGSAGGNAGGNATGGQS